MSAALTSRIVFEDRLRRAVGYWEYTLPGFDAHLQQYLPVFGQFRAESKQIPSETEWEQLPFGPFACDSSWKWRRQSLKIMQHFLKNRQLDCILEIGSWNGWLTQYLARQSGNVIGLDYFTADCDGLGNLEKRAANIIGVQCDIETVAADFKPGSFGLIVLNHNLSFMENPAEYIIRLIPLLENGGNILSLGNAFFRNPKRKIENNDQAAAAFYEKYNTNLYIQHVKGYLDSADASALKKAGFRLKPYPGMPLQNLYARFNPSAPYYMSISYTK